MITLGRSRSEIGSRERCFEENGFKIIAEKILLEFVPIDSIATPRFFNQTLKISVRRPLYSTSSTSPCVVSPGETVAHWHDVTVGR